MKISKGSWHYKLYSYVRSIPDSTGPKDLLPFFGGKRQEYGVPKSLCPYAWIIALGLIGSFLVLLFTAIALLFYGLYLLVAAPVSRTKSFVQRVDTVVFAFKHRGAKQEQPPKPKKEKRPSLVAAFVKSRKNKVCPMIELVD